MYTLTLRPFSHYPAPLSLLLFFSITNQGWEQETRCIALKWGTRGFEDIEKNRPQFFGDSLERSSITGDRELYYPEEKRWWIVSRNLVYVFIVIILDLALFGAIFFAENLVYTQYPEYEFPFFDW